MRRPSILKLGLEKPSLRTKLQNVLVAVFSLALPSLAVEEEVFCVFFVLGLDVQHVGSLAFPCLCFVSLSGRWLFSRSQYKVVSSVLDLPATASMNSPPVALLSIGSGSVFSN